MRRLALAVAVIALAGGCSSPARTVPHPTYSPASPAPAFSVPPVPDTELERALAEPSPEATETSSSPRASRTPTKAPRVRRTTAPPAVGGFLCRDGSMSHAKHRQGACSHHGGIA